MTKEETLQKVNEYCNEKSYTTATLTDEFKDKFSDFFSKKYAGADADDAAANEDLRFNLNTAFSAASKGITAKQKAFEERESDYKRQIEELNRVREEARTKDGQTVELSAELRAKLEKLEAFEVEARKEQKFKDVLELAKKEVRADLHKSLENYATDFVVTLDEPSEEQAKKLTSRFQTIFRDTIGDTKPLSPKSTRKQEEEFLAALPKIKVK